MENANILPETSEKHDLVLGQLMKAKNVMGSAVKKDAQNPFHKSRYASLGAHLDVSESVLFDHGLLMIHTTNMINGKPCLIATLHHPESGQWIKSYLDLPNPKNDSQGIGASITYMRRYSINSMLGLNAEDDDGETSSGRGKYQAQERNNANHTQPKDNAPATKDNVPLDKVGKAEVIALSTLVKSLDDENQKSFLGWIKTQFNAQKIEELPKASYDKCMITLNAKIKYLKDQQKAVA